MADSWQTLIQGTAPSTGTLFNQNALPGLMRQINPNVPQRQYDPLLLLAHLIARGGAQQTGPSSVLSRYGVR